MLSQYSERGFIGSRTNFYWYGLGWMCQLSTSPLKRTQSLHSAQPARQTPESMQHGTVLSEKSRHGGNAGYSQQHWLLLVLTENPSVCSTCLISEEVSLLDISKTIPCTTHSVVQIWPHHYPTSLPGWWWHQLLALMFSKTLTIHLLLILNWCCSILPSTFCMQTLSSISSSHNDASFIFPGTSLSQFVTCTNS